MISVGLILIILGYLMASAFLWSLGVLVLVVGLALLLLGSLGHAVRGRRHYY
ncbi:MAG TPA: DUF6131 family protein [Acidimicrobiales bacterium]|nr:DUF6131 family protein [Acidimicrobiales bacterium]